MKYTFLLLLVHLTSLSYTQITFIHTDTYYDNKFIKLSYGCACKNQVVDSSYIHGKDTSGNIMVYALDSWRNLRQFELNKEHRYTYESFSFTPRYRPLTEEDKRHQFYMDSIGTNSPYLDTVYLNGPLNERRIEIILVNNPVNFPYYKPVFINGKIIDNLNKRYGRPVLCPDKIDNQLIAELNARLIDLGYLSRGPRKKYLPAIRDALIEFQKDHHLPWGYVDQQTLDNLDIDLIISKY